MKTLFRISAFATPLTLALAMPAHAAGNTATVQGTASANIVAPLVLSHTGTAALNFGKFTAGTGGTVVVTAAGVGSATANVVLMTNPGNSADSFTVTGDNSRSFSVTSSNGTVTYGAASMSFTTTPSAASVTTSSTGAASFTIGGTLAVPSGAATGAYTGNYTVTVTYN